MLITLYHEIGPVTAKKFSGRDLDDGDRIEVDIPTKINGHEVTLALKFRVVTLKETDQ